MTTDDAPRPDSAGEAPRSRSPASLAERLRELAAEVGFHRCGICPAVTPTGLHHLYEWIARGYAGTMDYLERRQAAYQHPDGVLAGCRTIVALALDYRTIDPAPAIPGTGRVSRYAWGEVDYHDWIHRRLKQLKRRVLELAPAANVRGVVDTAPLLERDFARLAGLGWQGKNTMLIRRDGGSWFFLAFLLLDLELPYDSPHESDHCGTCTACLEACPTAAFPEPYVLDARRCISYLTIEHRGLAPVELREGIGDWLFGCDICQEVCPWNRFAKPHGEAPFAPVGEPGRLDAIELLELSEEAFRERFRKTPLWRSKRAGLARNAALVLGNHPLPAARPALCRALADPEPIVRGAAAWALRQYLPDREVLAALAQQLERETEPLVVQELRTALHEDEPP